MAFPRFLRCGNQHRLACNLCKCIVELCAINLACVYAVNDVVPAVAHVVYVMLSVVVGKHRGVNHRVTVVKHRLAGIHIDKRSAGVVCNGNAATLSAPLKASRVMHDVFAVGTFHHFRRPEAIFAIRVGLGHAMPHKRKICKFGTFPHEKTVTCTGCVHVVRTVVIQQERIADVCNFRFNQVHDNSAACLTKKQHA